MGVTQPATFYQTQKTIPTSPSLFARLVTFFDGKKTYTVAILTIFYAIMGFFIHDLTQEQMIMLILQAAGLGGLRSGISKLTNTP